MQFTLLVMFLYQTKESLLKESFTNIHLDTSSEKLTEGHSLWQYPFMQASILWLVVRELPISTKGVKLRQKAIYPFISDKEKVYQTICTVSQPLTTCLGLILTRYRMEYRME